MSARRSGPSAITHLKQKTLKRVLGIFDLFSIGYGDLGSSIYYALGITALFALGSTPIALALAGVVFICTALTYAEMTATFHESGGSAIPAAPIPIACKKWRLSAAFPPILSTALRRSRPSGSQVFVSSA